MFNRRSYPARVLAIAFSVIGVSLILAGVALAAGFSVALNSATYDAGSDTTEFSYEVCSDGSQPSALSHWTLALCGDCDDPDPGPDNACANFADQCTLDGDPADCFAGRDGSVPPYLVGVKFEQSWGDPGDVECHTYTFKLDGDWRNRIDLIDWLVKAGGDVTTQGEVDGPMCDEPSAVTLSSFGAESGTGTLAIGVSVALVGLTLLAAGGYLLAKRRTA